MDKLLCRTQELHDAIDTGLQKVMKELREGAVKEVEELVSMQCARV